MEELEKDFVPYELAVKLKRIGFNEPCLASWSNTYELQSYVELKLGYIIDGPQNYINAPTFSQVFKWFREKYGLYSWVKLHNGYTNDSFYKTLPITWTIMESESGKQYYERDIDNNYLYDTYEQAQLACLYKLIEIAEKINNDGRKIN